MVITRSVGEIGLLSKAGERTATARAVTRCRLMVLEADDFYGLMETDPELRQAIERIAGERRSHLAAEDGA